jgi:hypothetical protein
LTLFTGRYFLLFFRYSLGLRENFHWPFPPSLAYIARNPERLKKYCSHTERGFLGFGEALAKERVSNNPATEPKRSQNPKRPLPFLSPFRVAAVFLKML